MAKMPNYIEVSETEVRNGRAWANIRIKKTHPRFLLLCWRVYDAECPYRVYHPLYWYFFIKAMFRILSS